MHQALDNHTAGDFACVMASHAIGNNEEPVAIIQKQGIFVGMPPESTVCHSSGLVSNHGSSRLLVKAEGGKTTANQIVALLKRTLRAAPATWNTPKPETNPQDPMFSYRIPKQ
jgi:hypothetical protein